MSRLEPADTIEAKVGARRHPVDHIGRAVSAEQWVYVLHSEECHDLFDDLRECPFSRALDRGIDVERWRGFEDQPVKLWVSALTLTLVPELIVTPAPTVEEETDG